MCNSIELAGCPWFTLSTTNQVRVSVVSIVCLFSGMGGLQSSVASTPLDARKVPNTLDSALTLKFELQRSSLRVGDLLRVDIRIKNQSKELVYIPQALRLKYNVRIVVLDSAGRNVQFRNSKLVLSGAPLEPKDLMPLYPQYSYGRSAVDEGEIRMRKKGRYFLIGEYQALPLDSTAVFPARVWQGRVRSAKIPIVVK